MSKLDMSILDIYEKKQLNLARLSSTTRVLFLSFILAGCSSVGSVSQSVYVESQLSGGTWKDLAGRSMEFRSDGSFQNSGVISQWKVDYPYLRFKGADGGTATLTIVTYNFESNPKTVKVRFESGFEENLEQYAATSGSVASTYAPAGIGVTVLPIDYQKAQWMGVSEGVYVDTVRPRGPADKAGVRHGDLIMEIDGAAVVTTESLPAYNALKKVGDVVVLKIGRSSAQGVETFTVSATLDSQ